MNKRYLAIVAGIAAVVLLIVWGGIAVLQWQNTSKLQGKLVFAKTFDRGEKVNKIVIVTAEDVIELRQKDSYWFLPKVGGYFADFKRIHKFLTSINQSVYFVKLPYNEEILHTHYLINPEEAKKDSGMLIRTYIDDEMLDEIIIGLPEESGRYFFARGKNGKDVWLIDGDFDLPITNKFWLVEPVFALPQDAIETIASEDRFVKRSSSNKHFADEKGIMVDTQVLQYILSGIEIVDAMSEAEFKEKGLDKLPQKTWDIVSFYGLKVGLTLYYNDHDQVWLKINLSTTPLPIAAVNDYIRDNSFLYDNWVFEVLPRQGAVLRDFRLM